MRLHLKFLPGLVLVSFVAIGQQMEPEWVNQIRGSDGEDIIIAIDFDGDGNVYVAGSFQGTVEFAPGASDPFERTAISRDAFFAKYSADGECLWVRQIETTEESEIKSILVADNRVYVGGIFSGTADFYVTPNTGYLTSAGAFDIFLAVYTQTGEALWAHRHGSETNDVIYSLDVDPNGDVYIGGYFTGTIDVDPSNTSEDNRTSVGEEDIFIGKYDIDGDLVFAHTLGSIGSDAVFSLAVDGNDNLYVGGYISGSLSLDPEISEWPNLDLVQPGRGGYDGFVAKYQSSTGVYWAGGVIGAPEGSSLDNTFVSSIAIGFGGHLFVGGEFSGTVDFNMHSELTETTYSGYSYNGFVASYDVTEGPAYTPDWVNVISSTDEVGVTGVEIRNSRVYASGYFTNYDIDFDPSDGSDFQSNHGMIDAFLSSYDAESGAYLSTNVVGGSGSDVGAAVVADVTGNVYFGGYFSSSITAGGFTKTSAGSVDGFLIKYPFNSVSEPTWQPTNFKKSNVTSSSATISFDAAEDSPDGYMIVRKAGSAPNFTAYDATPYEAGWLVGDVDVVYVGSATSFDDTGLTAETTYYYEIFSFNGSGSEMDVLSYDPLDGTVTTNSASTMAPEPSAQPGIPDFTEITSTTITYSFAPAPGGADGYIAIATVGFDPFNTPVDGVEYQPGNFIEQSDVFSVGPSVSGIRVAGLSPSTTYKLRIYSYNGSGTDINYLTVNPTYREVTTTAVEDATPPNISHSVGTSVASNTEFTVSAQITDSESGISMAYIFYTATEEADEYSDFHSSAMTNTGGSNYTFNIPASEVKGMSVTYFIYAKNGAGGEVYSDDFVKRINVPNEGLKIPFLTFGSQQSDFRIVSFPLTPNNNSVGNVLGDELGSKDDSKWRMFHYANGALQQLGSSSPVSLGKGYWLIVKEKPSGDFMTGPGSFSNASVSDPFTIALTNGWNQIGNPYNFDLSWSDILKYNENPTQVSQNLKVYKGSWSNGQELEKFSGGFVFATGSYTLRLLPFKNSSINGRKKSDPKMSIDGPAWEVDLRLSAGDVSFDLAGIGMNPEAQPGFDRFDDVNLPHFLNYVELKHSHQVDNFTFSRDVVPPAENHIWEFEVDSNSPSEEIQLTWDNTYFGANDVQLILWDVQQEVAVDMRSTSNYRFSKIQSKKFRVYYGNRNFINQNIRANSLHIYHASPNPSEGEVVFSFAVPESGAKKEVRLEVFDLLGHKIATVVNRELEPGLHVAEWNGLDDDLSRPAAGVYLTLLRSGNQTDVCRIILK